MHTATELLIAAIAIGLLVKIALVDFKTQKIANNDVLTLAILGLGSLLLQANLVGQGGGVLDQLNATGGWENAAIAVMAGGLLFLLLFPFWLLRKVGAGDVKLMGVAPLISGGEDLILFSLLLLAFTALTAFVVKNPMLLPAPAFRHYVEHLDRKGVVPFGVPIAAGLIGVVLAGAYRIVS
ncbi:prepilin peptidase [Chelativorans alearense]|uniref:prepilin peptidase n=1 Tax=Chelativorans alearense TaxID=2681495 RepID=UPI0013D65D8F|nr:prepilin peptidase [Chelativorans alearense]